MSGLPDFDLTYKIIAILTHGSLYILIKAFHLMMMQKKI